MDSILLTVFNYVAVIFSVGSAIISVFICAHSFLRKGRNNEQDTQNSVKHIQMLLEEFSKEQASSNPDAKKLASIFGELGRLGYITLHKLPNTGEKHDDELQTARFRFMLSQKSVERLNCMRG